MHTASVSVEELLKGVQAWQTGHFLLSSGLHSSEYMQGQRVLQYPRHGLALAEALCQKLREAGIAPDSVVGPALGAIHWEVFVASALDRQSPDKPVRAIFAERADGPEFSIRRGIALKPGEKVLVVEDVTTTGASARKVVDLARSLGAEPIAVAAIVDRSGGSISFGIPFISLLTIRFDTFEQAQCPMCKQGVAIVKPGTTKIFDHV